MAQTTTYDAMALELILDGEAYDSPRFQALARSAAQAVDPWSMPCPHCASEGPHECNGDRPTSAMFTLLCTDCGEQWMPNERGGR